MRSRLTSANSSRKTLLKPRLGRRRCSGIWPPSKPLMRTPERAVWPLPPRPEVLPRPEPMPRPTRLGAWRDPCLSRIWLSFICLVLLPASADLLDRDEVVHLGNHAADRRRVLQLARTVALVEAEADQRVFLVLRAPDWAADLGHAQALAALGLGHRLLPRRLGALGGLRRGVALAPADDVADLLAAL